jgi:DNA-binding NarL/FixJ family response regulator
VAGSAPIDVVIVEDNEVFREALEVLFGLTPDLNVVASLPDGSEALRTCPDLQPDVILVDYRLPGLDGVETTRALREACPSAAIVVLTAVADPPELAALEAAGAATCLTKDRKMDEIVGAVRAVARGTGGLDG